MGDRTGIAWTEALGVVQRRDALSKFDAGGAYLIAQPNPRRSPLITRELYDEFGLGALGYQVRPHPFAEALRPATSHLSAPLRLEGRTAPRCLALTEVRVVVHHDDSAPDLTRDPIDSRSVSHRPCHGRVHRSQPVGASHVDRAVAISESSEIRQLSFTEQIDEILWACGVSFCPESQIAGAVALTFSLGGGGCNGVVHAGVYQISHCYEMKVKDSSCSALQVSARGSHE